MSYVVTKDRQLIAFIGDDGEVIEADGYQVSMYPKGCEPIFESGTNKIVYVPNNRWVWKGEGKEL